MSDKIQKIKQEIERLKHNTPNAYDLSRFMLLEEIESFIDSLPKEPASKDLEEEIDNYFKDWTFDDEMSVMVKPNHYFAEFNDIKEIARHFAEWQKEKYNKQFGFFNLKDCKDAYNEWKSTQDEPSVALAWVRGCQWQKQQMMKDFLEKAEEWLESNLIDKEIVSMGVWHKFTDKDVEQFKNYMKDEM